MPAGHRLPDLLFWTRPRI